MRAEVEALEQSLVRSSPTDEDPGTDPEWTIGQVRRALIEGELRTKLAELALLTERAGFPQRNVASRVSGPDPVIAESYKSTGEAPPALRKGGPRLGPLGSIESAQPASEAAMPDAVLEEARADGEVSGPEKAASQPGIPMSAAEAAGLASGPEAQVGTATGPLELSVESPTISSYEAEALYGARETRRRAVAVLALGGLLVLVVGALFAGTGTMTLVPGILWPESAIDTLTLMVSPVDDAAPEPADVSGASQAVSAGGAGSSVEGGLEPELDGIAEREREAGLEPTTERVGDLPSVVLAATIDAPGFGGVNLRRAPSTSAAAIQVILTGTRVELLDGQVQDDDLGWQQIRAPDGEVGWVVSGTIQR